VHVDGVEEEEKTREMEMENVEELEGHPRQRGMRFAHAYMNG